MTLTWVSEQRDNFKAYLLQNEAVDFNYKGTDYHVEFAGASVYPQGFAAVAGIVKRFQGLHMLCDIGNGRLQTRRVCKSASRTAPIELEIRAARPS